MAFPESPWIRLLRFTVLAPDGTALNHYQPRIERTQDWKRVDIVFNSLACKKVNVYFGVWGGKRGKIWWDDCRIEPAEGTSRSSPATTTGRWRPSRRG